MFPLKDENPSPPGFKPRMTYALIAVNLIVFVIQIFMTGGQFLDFAMVEGNQLRVNTITMYYTWGAVPYCITEPNVTQLPLSFGSLTLSCPDNQYLPLLSSMFMHGGILHLGGNLLFLWIFGDNIEQRFGRFKYLGIYLMWGVVASLAHIYADPSSTTPAVGASGAISGVLGAYLIIFPRARILTFMMLGFFWRMMHIQAKWFLPFWLIFQNLLPLFIGSFGFGAGGVAYLAHIGGFLIGFATGYLYKKTHSSEFTYGTRYGYRPYYDT